MNNSITPLSGEQTLNAVQTTPTLQSVSLSVTPGIVKTLKTVGTAFYISACYFLDDAGNRISTAARVAMNSDSPFLVEAGTEVEFEHFGRPFNELHFYALADKETFLEIQVAYMLKVSGSHGAGTASDIAHLQEQISKGAENLSAHIKDLENPHKTTLQQVLDAQTEMNVTVRGAKNIITAPVDGSFSGVLLGDFAARLVSVDATTGDMAGFLTETYVEPDGKEVRIRIFGAPLELSHDATEPEHAVRKNQLDALIARVEALENAAGTASAAPFVLNARLSHPKAASILLPIDNSELNGEVSAETNADWLSADASGNIRVEELT